MKDGVNIEYFEKKHMCLNVSGALSQTPKNDELSFADNDDGTAMTNNQLRIYLMKAQSEGKRVLPIGDCDNFDYQTGCKGHNKWQLISDILFEEGNG